MSAKVFIIEDERDVTEVMVETLKYEGIEACVCHSGEDALKLLAAQEFQLLIVDLRLEGTASGVDVIREVASKHLVPNILIASATPKDQIEDILDKENLKGYVKRLLDKPSDLRPDRFSKIVKSYLD